MSSPTAGSPAQVLLSRSARATPTYAHCTRAARSAAGATTTITSSATARPSGAARPRLFPASTTPSSFSAGANHTCARRATGEVVCWGLNDVGQLGQGMTSPRGDPAPVVGLADAVQISIGYEESCARRANNTIACWGRGAVGSSATETW